MRVFTFIAGLVCLLAVLLDAFQTIILPRRATGRFRLTRIFYVATWGPWVFFTRRFGKLRQRESAFSYYGPMSLIFLLAFWAGAMVVGFALLYYALGSPFNDAAQGPGVWSDLYVSGTTLFTLGLGDVTPHGGAVRAVIILESGTGLGLLAVVMGYFPVLYAAFSRREVSISLLDARAGSPPTAAEHLLRLALPALRRRRCRPWWSGNAGPPSCWKATSPIRCCATSAPSTPTRAGLALSPPCWILPLC